jgi:hypothetical protein
MIFYNDLKQELITLTQKLEAAKVSTSRKLEEAQASIKIMEEGVKQMAKERQIGFPWLARAYEEYFELQDRQLVDFLKYKKTPALQSSEIIKAYGKIRREAIKDKKIAEYIVAYYEDIAPFLLEYKEEIDIPSDEDIAMLMSYSKEEREDETTNYLTKEEFRRLSTQEKNQLALNRFWKRKKSKWLIGILYERYIGYLFEENGYNICYNGIEKGLEDRTRDLICKKDKETFLIQCKNWSHYRTIYDKHIFQFFGSIFQYRYEHPTEEVKGSFYTSTQLSDLARIFAQELNIEIKENCKFDISYPSIKCNISKNKEKIYHLPFDQQYDNVRIEKNKGEFYCSTVQDAENAGFRRARKWMGNL